MAQQGTDGLTRRLTQEALSEDGLSPSSLAQIPTVTHSKHKGGDYKQGSPLYAKQQQLKQQGKLDDTPEAAPQVEGGAAAKAAAPSGGKPEPMFTEETMPKVSPTVQCVISLSIQYFCIYTALAILRTMNEFTSGGFFGVQKICEVACSTVTYAPMLCVLFIGTRMRAIQLSQGETEKYKLPQPWVQGAMYWATYAVLAQVILVLIIPIVTGSTNVEADEEGNVKVPKGNWMQGAMYWATYAVL